MTMKLFKKGIFNTNADVLSRVSSLVTDKGVTVNR
jgi:hypothetical protein